MKQYCLKFSCFWWTRYADQVSNISPVEHCSQIHILNETRGATLEVVISRMKTRSQGRVRFVLVSATVPNIADVAGWIQSGGDCTAPATVFQVSGLNFAAPI